MIIIEADYHDSPKIQDLMFPPIPPNVDLVGPALFPPRASASANLVELSVIHRQHGHGMVPFRDLSFGWFPLFFNQIRQP